ncbi:hypothetical protein GGU11DRAFT_833735 [Lentinula aff. detonsa]|nr:hypothetical protein GGU11DRAFT_833735 [Lentinula aff. detonsa]
MNIYLPPPPEPASPSKRRPDTTQLNDQRHIIDNRRALKRIMTECIVYRLKQAPPSFESTVESSSSFKIDYRFKKTLKTKGVKLIEEIMIGTMNWSDLDKADLALYQKGDSLFRKDFFTFLSPSSITSLVEGLLIELGEGGDNITVAKIQAMVVICLKDFGHIFRRWQPLKRAFEADIYYSSMSFFIRCRHRKQSNTKKRGREEESSLEGQRPFKKAKFEDVSNRTSLVQRFSKH